eukprot:6214739-Pleurochrysis_carterae.AAC.2
MLAHVAHQPFRKKYEAHSKVFQTHFAVIQNVIFLIEFVLTVARRGVCWITLISDHIDIGQNRGTRPTKDAVLRCKRSEQMVDQKRYAYEVGERMVDSKLTSKRAALAW